MSWLRIEDTFFSHPKALRCSPAARGIWVSCLSWSASQLSDGFVPEAVPRMVGAKGNRLPQELVDAGLWSPAPGGWQIVHYLIYNPSRDQVLAEREAQHEAKVRAGLASAKARREGPTGTAIPSGARNHPDRLSEQDSEQTVRFADRLGATEQTEQTPNPIPSHVVVNPKGLLRGTAARGESSSPKTTKPAPICPGCGKGNLRDRTNPADGHAFVGCTQYPACSWTDPVYRRLSDRRQGLVFTGTTPLAERVKTADFDDGRLEFRS